MRARRSRPVSWSSITGWRRISSAAAGPKSRWPRPGQRKKSPVPARETGMAQSPAAKAAAAEVPAAEMPAAQTAGGVRAGAMAPAAAAAAARAAPGALQPQNGGGAGGGGGAGPGGPGCQYGPVCKIMQERQRTERTFPDGEALPVFLWAITMASEPKREGGSHGKDRDFITVWRAGAVSVWNGPDERGTAAGSGAGCGGHWQP